MKFVNLYKDNQQNNIVNILNLPITNEVDWFQQQYCNPAIIYLQNAFKTAFDNFYTSTMAQRLALYVTYNLGLIIVYLLIWQPMLIRLNNDLWRTKTMLKMIPLKVMVKIKSIRSYLKELI